MMKNYFYVEIMNKFTLKFNQNMKHLKSVKKN